MKILQNFDVIFGPNFTKDLKVYQRNCTLGKKLTDWQKMENWYNSVKNLNLNAVIFHNELSDTFIEKYQTSKIIFENWKEQNRLSYNDERFFAFLNYLKNNPQIKRVFCTDIYDIIFYKNPFELMDLNPDYKIFSGSQVYNSSTKVWMGFKYLEINQKSFLNTCIVNNSFFNAGIIGGYRENIIYLFEDMIMEFEKIDKKLNSNMAVYNVCLSKIKEKIFYGYPLHNIFMSNVAEKGVYIKHK